MCVGAASSAQAGGGLFAAPRIEPGEVRWVGADADGRWSIVAGARRLSGDDAAADAAFALPLDPFLKRHAIAPEATVGGLALDAMRHLGAGERIGLHVSARRAGLSLRDDTAATNGSFDERAESRAVRSQLAAALAWSRPGRWGAVSWTRTLALRVASETLDSRTAVDSQWSGARSTLRRDDAAEQRASLEGVQGFDLVRGLALETGVRLEARRAKADPAGANATFLLDTVVASRSGLRWSPVDRWTFFARAQRGPEDASASWLARDPFRGGVAVAVDPLSFARTSDAGARWTPAGWDVGVSAWHAQLPYSLAYSVLGVLASPRPSDRHGWSTTIAWHAIPGLAVDATLFLDRSRDAEGPALPGAPQVFGSAGATLRMSRDWDAKLRVNYLGPREAMEDQPALKSTTLANLELVRWFGRTTRLSLDVFNVFNQRPVAVDSFAANRAGLADGTGESFLSSPSEPRAFLLKFRTRF